MKLGTQKKKNLTKATKTDTYLVPLDEMYIDPEFNARRVKPFHVNRLVKLLAAGVQLPPIVVRTVEPGRFLIIDGQHRYLAAKEFGKESFEVKEVEGDDADMMDLMLGAADSLPLRPLERARGYDRLIKAGRTRQQVAERHDRHITDINNHLMLLEMPIKLQIQVDEDQISYAEALKLYRANKGDAEEIAQRAFEAAEADGKKVTGKYVSAAREQVEKESSEQRKAMEATSAKSTGNPDHVSEAREARNSDKPEDGEAPKRQPLKVSSPFGAAKARALIELLCDGYVPQDDGDWLNYVDIARLKRTPDIERKINDLFRQYAEG